MLQNAAIDVAIGLVLMYLVLSLLCTVVNEYIATKLNLRAASLASALQEILDDPWVRSNFYAHGLIAGPKNAVAKGDRILGPLIRNLGNLRAAVTADIVPGALAAPAAPAAPAVPSAAAAAPPAARPPADHPPYISSSNFAAALIGSLDTAHPVPGFAGVEATIASMDDSRLKSALLSALTIANGDLDKLRKALASWFDDSMERLGGAYKRHLKLISAVVGLAVTILFNADSFHVARTLWNDPELRGQVVATATETAKANATAKSETVTLPGVSKAFTDTEDTLRPLPIGWHCGGDTSLLPCMRTSLRSVTLLQILGWLLTATALSLGAPFWFDLLSKFINIRGTGVKPVREDQK